jgi:hypothetical protein
MGRRIPSYVRLLSVGIGGPIVVVWMELRGHDSALFIWSSLLTVWVVGSGWVLAARAREGKGWGELQVNEVVFIPLLLLILVVGLTCPAVLGPLES